MEKVTLKCAMQSLCNPGIMTHDNMFESAKILKEWMKKIRMIDLELIAYSTLKGPFGGGRPHNPAPGSTPYYITTFNEAGVGFDITLNGAMDLESLSGIDMAPIRKTLDLLDFNQSELGVKNSVTITNDALLEWVKEKYPGLRTYASCIRRISPKTARSYEQDLKAFDGVIPLNQHTTPGFLKQYDPTKLMVFLNHFCSNPDLYQCLNHYANAEKGLMTSEPRGNVSLPKEAFNPIPTQLGPEITDCYEGHLVSRPNDFQEIVDQGVRAFKVPRDMPLSRNDLDALCYAINPKQASKDPTRYIKEISTYSRKN